MSAETPRADGAEQGGLSVYDTPSPQPPAWVSKRDGQLEPFEADKISRALFAAAEELGRPDAFLARELADGVVHFLTVESEGDTPTTEQIAELVVKIVRELGQPALAEAFARFGDQRRRAVPRTGSTETERPRPASPAAPPDEVVLRFSPQTPLSEVLPACVRGYTLQTVFTRDLVSAQADGLLTLTGLESPAELAGCLLGPPFDPRAGVFSAIEDMRRFAGRFVVLDGPEHLLAADGQPSTRDFVRDLAIGLRLTGLHGIVNLNSAAPPSWAGDLAEGPLFAGQRRASHDEQLHRLADELLLELLHSAYPIRCADLLRIDWHLAERDFGAEPARRERLLRLARLTLDSAPLGFVFDRPRRPVALAEGVDRQHPAVLLTVGLHLPRLALQSGIDGDPGKFLTKLGSLARLALSAGVQKREYLRRLERGRSRTEADGPALTSGFLLDRASLMVAPLGLDAVVYSFLKKGLSAGGAALDFGKQIVQRLRDVLRQDGRNAHLDTCVDGPFHFRLPETTFTPTSEEPAVEQVAGLSPWDATAVLKSQLRSAGVLHGVAEHGTLALFISEERPPSPEEVADWLQTAWRQTDVVRLRLIRPAVGRRQLTLGG
jgi:hypothetical protein